MHTNVFALDKIRNRDRSVLTDQDRVRLTLSVLKTRYLVHRRSSALLVCSLLTTICETKHTNFLCVAFQEQKLGAIGTSVYRRNNSLFFKEPFNPRGH